MTSGSRSQAPPVDGELLSCYGAALAAYLDATGRDWLGLLGGKCHLDLRPEADGIYAFRHLPPGLRAPGGPLPLVRLGTSSSTGALTGIGQELAASGAVIVVGDSFNLPWLTAHGRRHAPHWFVVDGRTDNRWHIRDDFRATDDLGEQGAWRGWAADGQLRSWSRRVPQLPLPLRLQERHAFGDEDDSALEYPRQWFAARARTGPAPAPAARSARWLSGSDALDALAAHFSQRGHRADGYLQADEIWAAARQRALHLRQVRRRQSGSGTPLAAARLARLTADWARLPMLIRYAQLSLSRPTGPRIQPIVTALRQIAAAEPAILAELAGGAC